MYSQEVITSDELMDITRPLSTTLDRISLTIQATPGFTVEIGGFDAYLSHHSYPRRTARSCLEDGNLSTVLLYQFAEEGQWYLELKLRKARSSGRPG